ncbi:hypothetical protein ACFY7H_24480 [Streptomyces sp. NPDC012794]|uniref:hypothetical protein n=1 Tax=Streptomyces sp. NPDC012794 TaxID=3364850 RepID=UPI0036907584
MEDLKRRLRDAAAAHTPDRDGMLERVRLGASRAVPDRRADRPLSWPRVTLATLASTAALVVGGYTLVPAFHTEGSGRAATTTPAAPAPPATPSTPPPPSAPPGTQDGPLRSDGAVDPQPNPYWSQSTVTLHTGAPLAALTLEVRVAQTAGVAATGAWRTLPEGDFTLTTTDEGGALLYRWTLKPGRTVPAGQHVFAVQYNHAPGARPLAGDSYAATAASATGQRHTVTGTFRPAAGATG